MMTMRIESQSLLVRRPRPREGRGHLLLSFLVWSSVGIATAGLHVALFWYFTSAAPVAPIPTPEEGAVMIEMAPVIQQAFSQTDAAVAQPQEEAQTAPEPVPEEPPPPPEKPMPIVEEAPVKAVAPLAPPPKEKPKPQKPREKVPPKPQKPIKPPTPRASAVRTASAPRSEQRASTTAAASEGASSAASNADWKSQVAAAINRSKRFPPGIMATGSPVVRLSIAASGAVTSATIVASSGAPELDRAAIETVYRASLPPPPSGATSLTFRMNFVRR